MTVNGVRRFLRTLPPARLESFLDSPEGRQLLDRQYRAARAKDLRLQRARHTRESPTSCWEEAWWERGEQFPPKADTASCRMQKARRFKRLAVGGDWLDCYVPAAYIGSRGACYETWVEACEERAQADGHEPEPNPMLGLRLRPVDLSGERMDMELCDQESAIKIKIQTRKYRITQTTLRHDAQHYVNNLDASEDVRGEILVEVRRWIEASGPDWRAGSPGPAPSALDSPSRN